jgi:hypothetical protein
VQNLEFSNKVVTVIISGNSCSVPKKLKQIGVIEFLARTQPLTEMRSRNRRIIMFLGSKVWPVRRADNLTAIFEPIV